MWFSRLNTKISHCAARIFLRNVSANFTAANPPPTITTLIGFSFLPGTHDSIKIPSTASIRGLANGFGNFVASLDVVELRLQEQSLGVQFVGGGGIRLRTQGGAFFHLLGDNAAGFGAQSQQFLRDLHHL